MQVKCIARVFAALTVFTGAVPAADAAEWPNKSIRVLAAGAAGGPIDIMSRLVGQKLTDQFGQAIVVDNRAGAGGTLATRIAAQATPDGHTLLCNSSQYVVGVSLYKDPGYDAFKDFAPIINAGTSPTIIFAGDQSQGTDRARQKTKAAVRLGGRGHYAASDRRTFVETDGGPRHTARALQQRDARDTRHSGSAGAGGADGHAAVGTTDQIGPIAWHRGYQPAAYAVAAGSGHCRRAGFSRL